MLTLEEIYQLDPNQRYIDEGAGWGAEQMLKAGIPIFYRDEQYPETLKGEFFVKEHPNGERFIVRKYLAENFELLEEAVRPINAL
jgi:hypothetical protein|nr:hypothetical protein [uncultured Mucilaginibacter sp.]